MEGLAFLSLGGVVGLYIILSRMPTWLILGITSNLFIADSVFTVLMYWVHFGTFAGLAVATLTALGGSFVFQCLKKTWGYRDGDGVYHRGLFNAYTRK